MPDKGQKNLTQACHFQTTKKKNKKKSLKKRKTLTYSGTKIRITSSFSETIQARRKQSEIFKMFRGKKKN